MHLFFVPTFALSTNDKRDLTVLFDMLTHTLGGLGRLCLDSLRP